MKNDLIYMSKMGIIPGKEEEFEKYFNEAEIIAQRYEGLMWLLNPLSPLGSIDNIPRLYVAFCKWENKKKWETFEASSERKENIEKIKKCTQYISRKWFSVVID